MTTGRTSGFTLTELLVALAILTVIASVALSTWTQESRALRCMAGIAELELRAQETLERVESGLRSARGFTPTAFLTQAAQASDGSFTVDGRAGFPDRGILLVARGTAAEERVRYTSTADAPPGFTALERGEECTVPSAHAAGEELLWAGMAVPIALQDDPPADQWDGVALELDGPTYFRGDGTGFCFQVPTDPAGGNVYLVDGEPRWGATVNGRPTLSGWSAFTFEPGEVLIESDLSSDLNGDGDLEDLFDLGKIRLRTWDASDPAASAQDVGLGPTNILQERCQRGGDLDGDGYDDPLFLWNATARRLHVRLFCAGQSAGGKVVVRRAETTIFLRNAPVDG